ncbi:uncharacterized protein LOC143151829 [Ptiloglossa arizonensis]|uniref:uncharacterized protein LOC143151829 n=1 Tax=Ptiloglossa arizonensis TaxID=3350558 RepID=UPI003F9FCF2E
MHVDALELSKVLTRKWRTGQNRIKFNRIGTVLPYFAFTRRRREHKRRNTEEQEGKRRLVDRGGSKSVRASACRTATSRGIYSQTEARKLGQRVEINFASARLHGISSWTCVKRAMAIGNRTIPEIGVVACESLESWFAKTLTKHLKLYCKYSKLAGFKYFVEPEASWFDRVFWTLLYAIIVPTMVYTIYHGYLDFVENPCSVNVDTEYFPTQNLTFPGKQDSLCSTTKLSFKTLQSSYVYGFIERAERFDRATRVNPTLLVLLVRWERLRACAMDRVSDIYSSTREKQWKHRSFAGGVAVCSINRISREAVLEMANEVHERKKKEKQLPHRKVPFSSSDFEKSERSVRYRSIRKSCTIDSTIFYESRTRIRHCPEACGVCVAEISNDHFTLQRRENFSSETSLVSPSKKLSKPFCNWASFTNPRFGYRNGPREYRSSQDRSSSTRWTVISVPTEKLISKASQCLGDGRTLKRKRKKRRLTGSKGFQVTPRCSAILSRCRFHDEEKNCSKEFEFRKTQDGFCCTFNYAVKMNDEVSNDGADRKLDPMKVENFGEENGLLMLLEPLLNDYFYSKFPITGWKVTIFNPHDYPDMTSGGVIEIFVPTETQMNIELQGIVSYGTKNILRYSLKHRHCVFPEEMILAHATYTYSDCIVDCRIQNIWEICRCIPFYMPNRDRKRVCNLEDGPCLALHESKWYSPTPYANLRSVDVANVTETLVCNDCYPECNDVTYNAKISESHLSPGRHETKLLDGVPLANQSTVHVYFSRPVTIKLKQDVVNHWYELLSEASGIGGIFIGFSLMAIVEFGYFVGLFVLEFLKGPTSSPDGIGDRNERKRPTLRTIYWNELYPKTEPATMTNQPDRIRGKY